MLTVETSGHDAGGGGFAHATNAGEEKGVRDASALERLREGAGDVLLTDQLVEAFRTPFAGEDEVR